MRLNRLISKSMLSTLAGLFVFAIILMTSSAPAADLQVINPYAEVDWESFGQYRANLHTHTTQSDGIMSPSDKIDAYHKLGYSILALTDHDTHRTANTTWPWTDYGRDPAELGMIAIHANEISRVHHIGSFFNDYGDREQTCERAALEEIAARGGLAVLYHPGRYERLVDWYAELYEKYDHLVGFEVYNQGDRYPGDRATWDQILTETMPERPVWGYSNDDAHREEHIGRNWQMFILPELTEDALRQAMRNGNFYFSYTPRRGDSAPSISNIIVDCEQGTISIVGEEYDSVSWISEGEEVGVGPEIEVAGINGYLRAVLQSDTGRTYTQPFYVQHKSTD